MSVGWNKHLTDVISSDLKEKLSSHNFLSDPDRSYLSQLVPVKEVRGELAPLHGLCTYELLEQIRYGGTKVADWDREEVPEDTEKWFSRLRETTSEWSQRPQDPDRVRCESLAREGMLSHQWGCMGDELLALDKATRVPRDAPEIQKIYKAARSIPEWVVSELHNEYDFQCEIEIHPMGSFVCDAKIEDADEFDFLLLCHSLNKEHINAMRMVTMISLQERLTKAKIYKSLTPDQIANITEPVIGGVTPHGPAITVEVTWGCNKGHIHQVDVDVTLAMRGGNVSMKSYCGGLRGLPVFGSVYDKMGGVEDLPSVWIGQGSTTCLLDPRMTAAMEAVSPNTTAAYRIVKVLVKHFLPSVLTGAISIHRCSSKTLVDSHTLKQILYEQVVNNPDPSDWSIPNIHFRVAEMLETVYKIINEGKQIKDIITDQVASGKSSNKYKQKAKLGMTYKKVEMGRNVPDVMDLVEIIKTGYTNHTSVVESPIGHHTSANDIPHRLFIKGTDSLFLEQGKLHPCKLFVKSSPIQFHSMSNARLAFKLSESRMLYRSHPLIAWSRDQIYKLYKSNPGIDLCRLPAEDIEHIWFLYTSGLITDSVIKNFEECKQQMSMLHRIYCLFGIKDSYVDNISMTWQLAEKGMNSIEQLKCILQTFPNQHKDILPVIDNNLKLLTSHEKALIAKLAQQHGELAIDDKINIEKGIKKKLNPDMIPYNTKYMREVLRCMSYICVLLCRYSRGDRNNTWGSLGVFLLIKHVVTETPGYFRNVSRADWDLAIEIVRSFIRIDKKVVTLTDRGRDIRWVPEVEEEGPDRDEWNMIQTEPGDLQLYRNFVVFGFAESRKYERTNVGMLNDLEEELQETRIAEILKQQVADLYSLHTDSFNDIVLKIWMTNYKRWKMQMRQKTCNDPRSVVFHEYLRLRYKELLAIAFLAKTQIHIYQRHNNEFIRSEVLVKGAFEANKPINLLFVPEEFPMGSSSMSLFENCIGRYDLMLTDQGLNIGIDIWREHNDSILFETGLAQIGPEDKDLTFNEFLARAERG